MGNGSTCCSNPNNKEIMMIQQKNAIFNEDCDVREWEADDFVLIGLCILKLFIYLEAHPVKEHKLFDQPAVIRRMESVEAPKLGERLDAFPEIEN